MALKDCIECSTLVQVINQTCNKLSLDDLKKLGRLKEIGKVETFQIFKQADGKKVSIPQTVPLHRYQYGDRVCLEKIIRNPDGDNKDMIVSEFFDLKNEPKNWQIDEEPEIDDISEDIKDFQNEFEGNSVLVNSLDGMLHEIE